MIRGVGGLCARSTIRAHGESRGGAQVERCIRGCVVVARDGGFGVFLLIDWVVVVVIRWSIGAR